MACDLTRSRTLECKDAVGGIKTVYFFDYGDVTITYDATNTDVIDNLGTTPTCYKYDLKGANSFEQSITSSRENGTAFFEQTLNLTLTKLTKEDHKELKLLSYGRPHIVIHDYNGNAFLMEDRTRSRSNRWKHRYWARYGRPFRIHLHYPQEQLPAANFLKVQQKLTHLQD